MTAGNEAWWNAMVGAAQFEDGSLVIQDDSLDVNGGSTVNLLVKLGAKPRSDVTVALSETSALISLGVATVTFTPDNWDTFQSVTVTGIGNRQAIALLAAWYSERVDHGTRQISWATPASERPQIISGLVPSNTDRLFGRLIVYANEGTFSNAGFINLDFTRAAVNVLGSAGQDLSDEFESNGSFTVESGGDSFTVTLNGVDVIDPYAIGNQQTTDFVNAVYALPGNQSGILTLRDYVPADAVISLETSGPAEYAGKTASVTVSVG